MESSDKDAANTLLALELDEAVEKRIVEAITVICSNPMAHPQAYLAIHTLVSMIINNRTLGAAPKDPLQKYANVTYTNSTSVPNNYGF